MDRKFNVTGAEITFKGEPSYAWGKSSSTVTMPELTHYGSNKVFQRELMRKAKATMGLTGVRGMVHRSCGVVFFQPYGRNIVMFIDEVE